MSDRREFGPRLITDIGRNTVIRRLNFKRTAFCKFSTYPLSARSVRNRAEINRRPSVLTVAIMTIYNVAK